VRRFWVSVYDNLYRTSADMQHLDEAALVALLTRPGEAFRVWDKGCLPMWSPVHLDPPSRKKAHVQAASCLVLDYDDGSTIEQAHLTWCQWFHVLHTSWSHKHEGHRFRVVLPFDRDVSPEEYVTIWRWAEAHCERTIDRACKDISRAWALPVTDLEDREHQARFSAEVASGPYLQPDRVLTWAPPAPVKPRRRAMTHEEKLSYRKYRGAHLLPEQRAELGHALGGVVNEECVKMVECPRCRQATVWWWLDPDRQVNAYCNHRKTCGWRGPVAALLADDMTFGSMEQ
jgi:hypothetical protein